MGPTRAGNLMYSASLGPTDCSGHFLWPTRFPRGVPRGLGSPRTAGPIISERGPRFTRGGPMLVRFTDAPRPTPSTTRSSAAHADWPTDCALRRSTISPGFTRSPTIARAHEGNLLSTQNTITRAQIHAFSGSPRILAFIYRIHGFGPRDFPSRFHGFPCGAGVGPTTLRRGPRVSWQISL